MKQILLNFFISFSSPKTRKLAFIQLLNALELHNDTLSNNDKDVIMSKALRFKESYLSAWFWNKQNVLINTLKAELLLV